MQTVDFGDFACRPSISTILDAAGQIQCFVLDAEPGNTEFDYLLKFNKLLSIIIEFGSEPTGKQKKETNKVRTTKYTILSWAPLSLLF